MDSKYKGRAALPRTAHVEKRINPCAAQQSCPDQRSAREKTQSFLLPCPAFHFVSPTCLLAILFEAACEHQPRVAAATSRASTRYHFGPSFLKNQKFRGLQALFLPGAVNCCRSCFRRKSESGCGIYDDTDVTLIKSVIHPLWRCTSLTQTFSTDAPITSMISCRPPF